MAGYRDKFIYSFAGIAPYLSHRILTFFSQQKLILPVYHLVSDSEVNHVKHLYSYKTRKAFIRDLDFLQKNYDPITLGELISAVHKNQVPKGNRFLLTFDDGMREFGEVVAPILADRGLSAICFLNNHFIDNRALFFRFKISLIIEHLETSISKEQSKEIGQILTCNTSRSTIKRNLLTLSYHDQKTIAKIAKILHLDFTKYLSEVRPYLTTSEIVDLIDQGFEFGAHSLDHPEYYLLDTDEQLRQTKESIQGLANKFQLDYSTFAFPFTDHQVNLDFFENLHKDIPNIDLTFGSAGQKRDLAPSHLQRIPLEMGTLSGESIIKAELLYHIFKRPWGKNILHRS